MHKLMIVDDSTILRRKISRHIDDQQFKLVATAVNGRDAVEKFKETQPDVVTMDLTMPELDGLGCIEQLIQIKPDVNILVVSALSDKATGIKALELGALGFLCKPFNEVELTDALEEIMEP